MNSGNESATARDGTTRERWEAERTTFQRVYDVLVGVREPAPVAAFARWAECSETGARSALEQLVEMGVAQRRAGRPAEYRRNDSYFRWRRIEDLAREHTPEELRRSVDELLARDGELQKRYGVPDPDAVTGDELVPEDHDALCEIRDDLTEWRTLRRDIGVLRRAERRAGTRESDGVSA